MGVIDLARCSGIDAKLGFFFKDRNDGIISARTMRNFAKPQAALGSRIVFHPQKIEQESRPKNAHLVVVLCL